MIPTSHQDLLYEAVVVTVVTLMPDGQPQATPNWCYFDGEHIFVNTAVGRQKDRNLQANPKVTILALDPKNPYRWLEVRGTVIDRDLDGALENINRLAKLYRGRDDYYEKNHALRQSETRVVYKIRPDKVNSGG